MIPAAVSVPAAGVSFHQLKNNPHKAGNMKGRNVMPLHRVMIAIAAAVLLPAALAFHAPAQAQAFPSKPITLIVPWPAGGSTDISMRAIAKGAEKHLGQSILVDNKGGASGTL